jgi:hypothetical protein
MYEHVRVQVTGEPGEDLELKARKEVYARTGERTLTVLSRDNREMIHRDGARFIHANFDFLVVPAKPGLTLVT